METGIITEDWSHLPREVLDRFLHTAILFPTRARYVDAIKDGWKPGDMLLLNDRNGPFGDIEAEVIEIGDIEDYGLVPGSVECASKLCVRVGYNETKIVNTDYDVRLAADSGAPYEFGNVKVIATGGWCTNQTLDDVKRIIESSGHSANLRN